MATTGIARAWAKLYENGREFLLTDDLRLGVSCWMHIDTRCVQFCCSLIIYLAHGTHIVGTTVHRI